MDVLRKAKLVKPVTIWMDQETIDMWLHLASPRGGVVNVPEEVRRAIKQRLKEISNLPNEKSVS